MLNPDLPLTVIEYEEWGNPNIPEEYEMMYAYDPYAQYTGQPYPPMLIASMAFNDPRWLVGNPPNGLQRLEHSIQTLGLYY